MKSFLDKFKSKQNQKKAAISIKNNIELMMLDKQMNQICEEICNNKDNIDFATPEEKKGIERLIFLLEQYKNLHRTFANISNLHDKEKYSNDGIIEKFNNHTSLIAIELIPLLIVITDRHPNIFKDLLNETSINLNL